MQVSGPARKEYSAACDAIKDGEDRPRHGTSAESRTGGTALFRRLGNIGPAADGAAENHRSSRRLLACGGGECQLFGRGYLCLADISGREQKWDEMLKFSGRAIDLDPANDAVAYGLNAAANLSLHKLPEAEKSALKAVEIDKTPQRSANLFFAGSDLRSQRGPDERGCPAPPVFEIRQRSQRRGHGQGIPGGIGEASWQVSRCGDGRPRVDDHAPSSDRPSDLLVRIVLPVLIPFWLVIGARTRRKPPTRAAFR